jgi:hypothetical protein
MAALGGTRKVIGSSIATPFTDPRPGIAPMNSPMTQPRRIMVRFRGCIASSNPSARCTRIVSIVQTSSIVFINI